MTDRSLYALVARATGESVLEISRRGFHDAMPLDVRFDPESRPRRPRRSGDSTRARRRPAVASLPVPVGPPEIVDLGEFGIDWDELLAGSRGTHAARSAGGAA